MTHKRQQAGFTHNYLDTDVASLSPLPGHMCALIGIQLRNPHMHHKFTSVRPQIEQNALHIAILSSSRHRYVWISMVWRELPANDQSGNILVLYWSATNGTCNQMTGMRCLWKGAVRAVGLVLATCYERRHSSLQHRLIVFVRMKCFTWSADQVQHGGPSRLLCEVRNSKEGDLERNSHV